MKIKKRRKLHARNLTELRRKVIKHKSGRFYDSQNQVHLRLAYFMTGSTGRKRYMLVNLNPELPGCFEYALSLFINNNRLYYA